MKSIGIVLLYGIGLAGGLYVAYKPTLDSGLTRFQNDTGDSVLNHYLLEHSWRCVAHTGYCGSLLSPQFFFPERLVLAYSENLLGSAPVYWALRLVMNEELAYPCWMLVVSALNFVAFALVARWLGCGHLLTIFGAYLWAFALVHIENAKHQQTITRLWMPLAAYFAWQLVASPGLRSLNRLLACVFLQATACVYTGWFLTVGLAVFVPVALMMRPGAVVELRRFVSERRWAILRVCGLWATLLGLFFTPYVIANWGQARVYDDYVELIPNLAAWLTGPPGSRWSATLGQHLPRVYLDCWLFSGFGLYLLFVAACVHLRLLGTDRVKRPEFILIAACLITAFVWWLLILRVFGSFSPWWVVRFVPGGQAIRAVCRGYVLIYLFGTLGVTLWLQALTSRIRRPSVRVAVILAIALPVIYEQTGYEQSSVARADFYPQTRECGEAMHGADAGYVLPRYTATHPERYWYSDIHPQLLAMWAGLYGNVPVVNGYSGRVPKHYPPPGVELTDEQLREWLRGRFRGRLAIVDPASPRDVRVILVE